MPNPDFWCSMFTRLSPKIISGGAIPRASVIFSIGSAFKMGNFLVDTVKPFWVMELPALAREGCGSVMSLPFLDDMARINISFTFVSYSRLVSMAQTARTKAITYLDRSLDNVILICTHRLDKLSVCSWLASQACCSWLCHERETGGYLRQNQGRRMGFCSLVMRAWPLIVPPRRRPRISTVKHAPFRWWR